MLTILLTGCSTLAFYTQAVVGQTSLLLARREIPQVIEDPDTDPLVREKLSLITEILAFARDDLDLPVGESYSTYVATGKRYVVWNVFAAPALSLQLRSFCYPVVGCVSYRGYFQEAAAEKSGVDLAAAGFDVFVGGVAAYSTLGWFADPVLDTFLNRSDVALAELLFHELAHKVVYISDDSRFSESFATAVAKEGVRRWLQDRGDEPTHREYLARQGYTREVMALIGSTQAALQALYASGQNDEEKLSQKQQEIDALRAQFAELQKSWPGQRHFQGFMAGQINNARLATVAEYNELVPAFVGLLNLEQGNFLAFYDAVRELGKLNETERNQKLADLATGLEE